MSSGHKWRPLKRTRAAPPSAAVLREWQAEFGVDEEEARRRIAAHLATTELWVNDLYQVEVERPPDGMVRINVRRRDGYVGRDWRHLQQIKNEIVGPECEAIEVFPAESRLVDTSNKYTLWAVPDPTFRFPVGWDKRDVREPSVEDVPGMRQAPLMQFARQP
jgi:hypothetical protein